jgi:hypothetical protein
MSADGSVYTRSTAGWQHPGLRDQVLRRICLSPCARSRGSVHCSPWRCMRSSPIDTPTLSQTTSTTYHPNPLKFCTQILLHAICIFTLFPECISVFFADKMCFKSVYYLVEMRATCDYCMKYILLRSTRYCRQRVERQMRRTS